MTIGYDAKHIVCDNTGPGSYGRTLINDIAEAATPGMTFNLYTPERGDAGLRRQITPRQNVKFAYPEAGINPIAKALWRTRGIVADLVHDGVKLYHGLAGELPVGIREAGIKTVVTIHDLIFMRHPEWYSWVERKFNEWNQSCGTRYKMREGEKKMQEVHTDYMLPERYIVSVGTVEERKNVLLAVKAMRLLPEDVSLVIVGKPTAYCEKVKRYVAQNGLSGRVMFLHNVPIDDLPAIYQMAEACVCPSRYEGFGLPVIEAIQSGLPVVACTGSCLEEAGGNATLYVDPDDVYGMADAMKLTLKGAPGRDERIAAGRQYISRFENNNVAQQVLAVYSEVLNG